MEIGTEIREVAKAPRKPRPSEIAAKKAKAAAKKKKTTKPKKARKIVVTARSRRSGVDLRKVFGTAKSKRKASKAKAAGPERSERIDCRVTKAEKTRIVALAKRKRRSVTSLLYEAVSKIK